MKTKRRELWQNNRIHGLLTKRRFGREERALLVRQITNGRTNSSKELTYDEANRLIHHLEAAKPSLPSSRELASHFDKNNDPADKMRKKILHYFHNMGWQDSEGKIDWQSVNTWMKNKSYLNKGLNDYTLEELTKLVSQVQSMHKKHLQEL